MITIEKTPHNLSLAGNPVRFAVQGSRAHNPIVSEDFLYHYSIISIYRNFMSGEKLVLKVDGIDVVFQVDWSGGVAGLASDLAGVIKVPIDDEVGVYIEEICTSMRMHPILSNRFNIWYDFNRAQIHFLGKGKEEIKFSLDSQPEVPLLSHTVYRRGGLSYNSNFSIHRSLYDITQMVKDEESGSVSNIDFLGDSYLSCDSRGKVVTDVSEFLQIGFKFNINYPWNAKGVIVQKDMCRAFLAEFNENIGNTSYNVVRSEVFYALPGRLPSGEWYEKIREGEDPCSSLPGNFLTTYPDKIKNVYEESIERLYFLCPKASIYNIFYVCENDNNYYMDDTYECSRDMEVIEIDVSPRGMREKLNLPSSVELERYRVYVSWDDGYYSTPSKYYKIINTPAYFEQFLFVNSFGALESAVLCGIPQKEYKYEREELSVPGIDSSYKAGTVNMDTKLIVGSGWIKPSLWRWLIGLQRSIQVYHVREGRLIPSVVASEKSSFAPDKTVAHEFAFKPSFGVLDITGPGIGSFNYTFDNTFDNTFN